MEKQHIHGETLATEAGIEEISELKKIFHRLSMLSALFNETDQFDLVSNLDKICPERPEGHGKKYISFIELDGEWTINLSNTANINKNFKKYIQEFYCWVLSIISTEVITHNNKHQREKIIINNEELTYLIDERNEHKGIYFPETDSLLFAKKSQRTGINLVITGPAGVGKSTLAMELVAKGTIENKNIFPVNAYYSLEQPQASIREIADRLGIKDNIINFAYISDQLALSSNRKPDYIDLYSESVKKHMKKTFAIFFPKLAPRSYGKTSNDNYLFWFRYKQIASLLEASRYYQLKNQAKKKQATAILNSIVIDNLNSFSRHPLARQQVHQLFKLISWSGQLGIYIIENNPSEKEKIFQSEVEFLADIVIRLDWHEKDYQYKFIEIAKSRCQRNVIGKHPFKIKRKSKNDESELYLNFGSEPDAGFEIYPSIHTQVSKSEKKQKSLGSADKRKFAINENLRKLVQKSEKDTGIAKDAFIMLTGRSGGHKLAIGLNYIHAKNNEESALVINLGQTIKYDEVADNHTWWVGGGEGKN